MVDHDAGRGADDERQWRRGQAPMSRHFYTAQTATVAATPPNGTFHALVCPGLPAWSIVVVEHWHDHRSEDTWNALPDVSEHYPENMGLAAPQAAITAFAPAG